MTIRRFIIRLRITLTIFFVVSFLTVVGAILYLNSTGLNEEIRSIIAQKLEKEGIYVKFDSLKYELAKGLVATNVSLYDDKSRDTKLASIHSVYINLDKTKLLRGIKKIDSISLTNADIELPVDPKNSKSPRIKINNINGNIRFPSTGATATNKLTAQYMGINVTLTGNLWQEIKNAPATTTVEEPNNKPATNYKAFLDYINQWTWDGSSTPPDLNIFIEGNISYPEKIKIEFDFIAPSLRYKEYSVDDLQLAGDFSHNLLTIDDLYFANNGKSATIKLDYDFTIRNGRYKLSSNIQIQDFFGTFFDRELFKGIQINGISEINAKGSFKLPARKDALVYAAILPSFIKPFGGLEIKAIGNTIITNYSYLGSKFDSLKSDFSWRNGDIYLDKLITECPNGYLKGRLLIKNNIVTYDTQTNLPRSAFKPFIKKGGKLEAIVNEIKLSSGSRFFCKSKGQINAKDLTEWVSDVEIHLCKFDYKGFYADSFMTKFRWANGKLTGRATLKDTRYKKISFQQLDSSFLWQNEKVTAKIDTRKLSMKGSMLDSFKATIGLRNNQLKLTDIKATHPSGDITGSFHTTDDYYHFDIISRVNPYFFINFLKNQKTIAFVSQAKIDSKSTSYISAKGRLNKTNIYDWKSKGQATFTNLKFNGVDLHSIKSDYKINPKGLLATNSKLVFDYRNYSLYKRYKGLPKGVADVQQTYVDNIAKTVTLKGIKGRAHPAPIARMFNKDIADHLEDYEFHNVPQLSASGVFDTIIRKVKDRKLNFNCNISCPGFNTKYRFLDGNLLLKNLSAQIQIVKNKVNIRKIHSLLFKNGLAQGNLYFTLRNKLPPKCSGDFNWRNIDFKRLGVTYDFDDVQRGSLRGNIQFTGVTNNLESFNTKKGTMGTFALENGNLFSVPVLGPVSMIINPFISPLAGGKALNERLKNISARYKIVNGVIITNDIQSLTPSLTFFGEGSVNLNNDKIDITIRVNYRGLLGKAMELGAEIIKLPIHVLRSLFLNKKPAETGLIQVRGRGNYKKPSWKLVPFDPPRNFNVPLFKPGKALTVPSARPVR